MRVLHNVSFIALLASGCSDPTDGSLSGQELYPGNPSGARWYSSEQVASGSQIFETNCAECHGANAEGIMPTGSRSYRMVRFHLHLWMVVPMRGIILDLFS